MENFMSEYADVIIPLLGVITAFLVWLQRRTEVRLRDKDAKLEAIENKQRLIQNEQIKLQSEAHTAAADRQNTLKLIEVIGATNERWQKVVDVISERKHDDETRLITVLDKLDASIDRNSQSVDELAGGLAGQLGNVAKQISVFSEDNKQTEAYIRSTKETMQFESMIQAFSGMQKTMSDLLEENRLLRQQLEASQGANLPRISDFGNDDETILMSVVKDENSAKQSASNFIKSVMALNPVQADNGNPRQLSVQQFEVPDYEDEDDENLFG